MSLRLAPPPSSRGRSAYMFVGMLVAAASLLVPPSVHAQQARFDALAASPMSENRPTPQSAETLMDELLF